MPEVLITGGNGFIGQYLSHYILDYGFSVVKTYRKLPENLDNHFNHYVVGNINADTQWQLALKKADIVIHLAARVHVMQETHANPLQAFREINTQGTLNLARQAVKAGVKRFIYLSTIKVNGERTEKHPFQADDQAEPQDSYAISKYEAEQQLITLSKQTGLEVVIIRPPLVYGPGVKGNFSRLIKLVDTSIPLPLAGIKNARSLVSIQNLCSFIRVCLNHPRAAGEVFLISDGQDLSTTDLFKLIASAMGKKSRLFYLPEGFVRFAAHLLGRDAEFERLFGSLQVDINKNKELLGWVPQVSVMEGIKKTIE